MSASAGVPDGGFDDYSKDTKESQAWSNAPNTDGSEHGFEGTWLSAESPSGDGHSMAPQGPPASLNEHTVSTGYSGVWRRALYFNHQHSFWRLWF